MIVGLTGSIGSGKSTVAQFFRSLDVVVVDSDQIAKELVAKDRPAFKKIVDHFGNNILNKDGTLNRSQLRSIIFESQSQRQYLENILHPEVKTEILKLATHCPVGKYMIIEIPLLIEANFENVVDRILVVDSQEQFQIDRIVLRDALSKTDIKKIIDSQTTRAIRLEKAHDVIVNNGSKEALKTKVINLHHYYSEIAKS